MHKKPIVLYFLLIFLSVFGLNSVKSQSAYEITQEMIEQTGKISSMKYRMKKTERINGQMIVQESSVKLTKNPLKVYTRQESPNDGLEVLYVNGKHDNKARINPNGFPWINLTLDPYGSTMRKSQHHTILNSGYDLFISILEYLIRKYGDKTRSMLEKSSSTWDGHACWVITINNPNFKFIEYEVQPGEDLLTIADKFKISEYMILERNNHVSDYSNVSAGKKIKIPNDYSPELVLYIDKVRKIPLVVKVYDDKGLFELYEYYDVVINPKFDPDEFTEGYSDYGF